MASEEIHRALAKGNPVVVVGRGTIAVPGHRIVVSADAADATLGPLEEARMNIAVALGEDTRNELAARIAISERRRLLGPRWEAQAAAAFVDACNRLRQVDPEALLEIDHAESLDDAAAETLVEVISKEGWLKLPLVLCFAETPPEIQTLLATLETHGATRVEARKSEAPAGPAFDVERLDPDARRVLRTTVVLGPRFTVAGVAALLEMTPLAVAESLQRAADLGAPIADRGAGRFEVPQDLIEALGARMLPSLVTLLHRRRAELLSGSEPGDERAQSMPLPMVPNEERPRYDDVFEASADDEAEAAAIPDLDHEMPRVDPPEAHSARRPEEGGDRARAAAHFEKAGELAHAVEQLRVGAEQAAAHGDPRRGLALLRRAEQLLEGLPSGGNRDTLRAGLALSVGEILWRGAVLGPPFTLDAALEALDAAAGHLPDDPDPGLEADIARMRAGVLYDRGDVHSLDAAIASLSEAIRALSSAGRPREAAELLNDQAAVYLRAGDPVQAFHLLSRSQEVFEKVRADDPDDLIAAIELAETDHLLAKLPLHAPLRPGKESDAYSSALDHALAAERVFRKIEDAYALARVWETMGRLEVLRGRGDQALVRLERALELQRRIGDVVGLARTTAALSDACFETERAEEALGLLADSIELNARKGSAIGLAYNRLAVAAAQMRFGSGELADAVASVSRHLEDAEQLVGRVPVPGT
jgi:tetratricopeptide (TPR) repeat protein